MFDYAISMKKMSKRSVESDILKDIEKLLGQQTKVILEAVDKRHKKESDEKFAEISKDTKEVKQAINQLAITLDKFLKRLADFNDEFDIIKAKVDKIEKILKIKLGISIS